MSVKQRPNWERDSSAVSILKGRVEVDAVSFGVMAMDGVALA